MHPHLIASFDTDLKALDRQVNEMAAGALGLLDQSSRALLNTDSERAQRVIAADRALDRLQHSIEENAVAIIARRQPVAIDLREIVSTIRIANDLERIGDLAKNIAKRVIAMDQPPAITKVLPGLSPLISRVHDQLQGVVDAYGVRDDQAALAIWRTDANIDALHTALFRELLTYMMEDPRSIGTCAHLLFCAKNLERVGDHATNIAETVHYMITGQIIATERPKADESSSVDPNLEPDES